MTKNYCKVTNAKVSGNKDTTSTSQMSLRIYLYFLLEMCDYDLSVYGNRNTQYYVLGILPLSSVVDTRSMHTH